MPATATCISRTHKHERLFFGPDHEREACPACATSADNALIDDLDRRAIETRALKTRPVDYREWGHLVEWPYGPNIDVHARQMLLDWANPDDLRLANPQRTCVHWLEGKRCNLDECRLPAAWMDHVTAWNRGSGRSPGVLVSQPYGLSDKANADLAILDADPRFRVTVAAQPGWYGHGTTFVAVTLA